MSQTVQDVSELQLLNWHRQRFSVRYHDQGMTGQGELDAWDNDLNETIVKLNRNGCHVFDVLSLPTLADEERAYQSYLRHYSLG